MTSRGGNESTLQRGAAQTPDRAPVRAQTYWHRSAPSALRLSWPPGLWAHLQIALGCLRRSESLSLCYTVRWERSSCDWKRIRPFYSTIWPVNQHLLQSFHIYRVLLSSVAATERGNVSAPSQRTLAVMPCWNCCFAVGWCWQCINFLFLWTSQHSSFLFFHLSACCRKNATLSVWECTDLYAVCCTRWPSGWKCETSSKEKRKTATVFRLRVALL